MAHKARSKIQKLLENLDLTDSGGVEAALAAAYEDTGVLGISTNPNNAALDDLLISAMASAGRPTKAKDDAGDSETEDSKSDITQESDVGPRRAPLRASARGEQFLYLERKVLQLMADNKALALALETTTRRKDAEIEELQGHLQTAVHEMAARQHEVETKAPILALRLEDFKDKLQDLRISDARYAELKSMDPKNLHVVDYVKMAAYEATSELSKENERLRLGITAARESAARAEEEASRARVESARIHAAMVEKEREVNMAADALQARVERLASELEAAVVRAELLSAKGQLYDELRAKADRLQEDNHRLQVIEANHKRLETQCHELQLFAKQKEHTYEMLVTDKAYLSKQVEFLSAAQTRLQSEVESRDAKISELTRQKQELFDKMIASETLKNKQEEARLQRELAALQASTHADMERIRVETSEAYEREARLLRELRDQAQEEAARTKGALADLQAAHEGLQLQSSEVQRRLEAQVVELQADAKQRAFEIAHLKVVVGEKESLLQRASLQADMLQDKLQVSMDRCRALEAEVATYGALTRMPHPPAAPADASASTGDGPSTSSNTGHSSVAGPAATLTQQVISLQQQVAGLKREKESLLAQVQALEASLRGAQEQVRLASQPHGFLLDELTVVKAAKQQAEVRAVAAQTALRAKEQELSGVTSERDALRTDLTTLLSQRGQLDSIKAVLQRTLAAAASGAPLGGGGLSAASARPGPSGGGFVTTTIVGEGTEQ